MLFGAAAGAALAYLFDPENGRDRRARLLDRGMSTAQRASERMGDPRQGLPLPTVVVTRIRAVRSRFLPTSAMSATVDEATLVDRIRSEALGDARIPAGEINVDVADGVATLRGELSDPALIEEIVERVRVVPGVLGVENLLHTAAQQPAANKRRAIRASERAAEQTPPTGEAIE